MKAFPIILFLSFLAAVLSAIASPSGSTQVKPIKVKKFRCPDFCTELHNPICATNNKCITTFGNPCKLDLYNCNRLNKDHFIPVEPKLCKKFNAHNMLYCW